MLPCGRMALAFNELENLKLFTTLVLIRKIIEDIRKEVIANTFSSI